MTISLLSEIQVDDIPGSNREALLLENLKQCKVVVSGFDILVFLSSADVTSIKVLDA